MSRLRWTGLLTASTSPSIRVDDESLRIREYSWHAFVTGTFGGSTPVVKVEYTNDLPDVADNVATWFAPTVLQFTAAGDSFFQAKPRRFRVVITGGDGTTLINVEIR
jgi:hypothetical protein